MYVYNVLCFKLSTYINYATVENRVWNEDRSGADTASGSHDAVSFIAAERIEDRRQRAVIQTFATIKPQQ